MEWSKPLNAQWQMQKSMERPRDAQQELGQAED
jgi:hypothetical protein